VAGYACNFPLWHGRGAAGLAAFNL